jgi:hypothetical protein
MSVIETIKKPFAIAAATIMLQAPLVHASNLEHHTPKIIEQIKQTPTLDLVVTETMEQISSILSQNISVSEREVIENFQNKAKAITNLETNISKKLTPNELKNLKNQVILLEAMIAQAELKALNSSFSDWIQIKYESLSVKLKFYYKLAKTKIVSSQIVIKIKNYIQSIIKKITLP